MRSLILSMLFCFAFVSIAIGQQVKKHPFVEQSESLAIDKRTSQDLPKPEKIKRSEKNQKQQTNTYVRPSKEKRLKRYANKTVGLGAFAKSGASAGIQTIANTPEEWEKTGEGFARRLASNFARNAIEQTVTYGLDEVLKVDSHYYKSKKKDFGSRAKNAVLSTVTARNKRGKRVFGAPRIVGIYSSNIIARETWYPDRFDYKDGLRSGTISLGVTAAFNLLREYF